VLYFTSGVAKLAAGWDGIKSMDALRIIRIAESFCITD
jgi:hypothetical protein